MRKKRPLQPYEIRALRIERNTVFDLLREIFSEVSYEKFQLPYETERAKNICIEWHFDEKQGEDNQYKSNQRYLNKGKQCDKVPYFEKRESFLSK